MTYKELLTRLQKMSDADLEKDVHIYDTADEAYLGDLGGSVTFASEVEVLTDDNDNTIGMDVTIIPDVE